MVKSRSTSIDLSHSSDYDQSDRARDHGNRNEYESDDDEEEEEPMLLPFNYRQKRLNRILQVKETTRKPTTSFKLIGFFLVAAGVGVWLIWRIVFGRTTREEGDSLIEQDEEGNGLNTVLNRIGVGVGTNQSRVDTGRIRGDHVLEEELGRDGEVVRMENGKEFVYRNPLYVISVCPQLRDTIGLA